MRKNCAKFKKEMFLFVESPLISLYNLTDRPKGGHIQCSIIKVKSLLLLVLLPV